jgi:hypothetical protein
MIVKKVVSPDGKHALEISSERGLFRFTELGELWDEGYGAVPGSFYWAPTHESGLYESEEAAEADARAILPWLRDLDTSPDSPRRQ